MTCTEYLYEASNSISSLSWERINSNTCMCQKFKIIFFRWNTIPHRKSYFKMAYKTTLRLTHANNLQLCSSLGSETEKAAESRWTRDEDFRAMQREQEVHGGPPLPSALQPPSVAAPQLYAARAHFSERLPLCLDTFLFHWCFKIITCFSCKDIHVYSTVSYEGAAVGHMATPALFWSEGAVIVGEELPHVRFFSQWSVCFAGPHDVSFVSLFPHISQEGSKLWECPKLNFSVFLRYDFLP